MVTTRRTSDFNSSKGGVELLERPATYDAYVSTPVEEEDYSVAKERMQRNLDKLLNYDRASEIEEEKTVEIAVEKSLSEEDIRPTSTTMQFGDDIDQIRKEMNAVVREEKQSYHLNSKGKFVMVLYALAITVILALIALNTNMLSNLSSVSAQKSAELGNAVARYNAIVEDVNSISGDEYVIDVAENQYSMIKK